MQSPSAQLLNEIKAANPFSNEIEDLVRPLVAANDRAHLGQVFTPYALARLMTAWIQGNDPATVLDPAAGACVFARALREDNASAVQLHLADLDPNVLQVACAATNSLSPFERHYLQEDFMLGSWKAYDAIIANPPYVRHHNLPDKSTYQSLLKEHTGVRYPTTSNLYCWFFAKALAQLQVGGRMAFITPSEFLSANYGVAHKRAMLAGGCWRYLITFDFADELFDDALTTSCITLFEHAQRPARELTIIQAHSSQLQAVTDFITGVGTGEKLRVHTHKNSELDPARKFARYLRAADLNDHANLVPFSEYARAKRGIATGDNSFFTLNESEISERGLKPSSFVLCLTKAQQTKTRLLTNKYMQDLKGSGQRVNLLYLDGSEDLNADSALATYIEEGEEREVNLRYLTRARTPWWAMERKDPPDIFATVFSREGIRFLRNEAGARSLACCHGIYVHESCDIELVMAWLLTDFAQEAVREERREYGAGLEKVEPGDINKSRIADFKAMTEGERELVLTQYRVWIQATRDDDAKTAKAACITLDATFRAIVTN